MREINAPIQFSPNLPDVSAAQAKRAFRSNSYIALLVLDVQPQGAHAGGGSVMNYPFVLVVSRQGVGQIYFVTLEESAVGTKRLGAFYGDAHVGFGSDASSYDERAFISTALSLAEQKLGERFVEMLPKKKAARKTSWLGKLFGR